jgi:glutathionyl-hydroquinone reductase
VYFKCNKNFIREYPNIRDYVKEIYQMPAINKCTNLYHIKTHYFTSHAKLNYYGVVPLGGNNWWEEPHNRDETHPISS